MPNKLTPKQAEEAVVRYQNGESAEFIGLDLGVVTATVLRYIRIAGCPVRCLRVLTPTLEDAIQSDYSKGSSSCAIAKKYGIAKFTVLAALRNKGVEIRSRSVCKRRYCLDELAFSKRSPEAMYWAGFLLADGSIYVKRYGSPIVQLSLAEEDRRHVELYRSFLKSTHPINTIPAKRKFIRGQWVICQPKAELCIPSRKLVADLACFGVVPQKSAIARPQGVDFDRDFWRGVIDGDGCLGFFNRTPRPMPYIHLCGSEQTILQFRQIVERLFPACTARVYQTGPSLFEFKCAGTVASVLVMWLYKDAVVSLHRKAEKAAAILASLG